MKYRIPKTLALTVGVLAITIQAKAKDHNGGGGNSYEAPRYVPYAQPQAPAQQPSNYREPRYVPYAQPQAPAQQQPSSYREPRYVPYAQPQAPAQQPSNYQEPRYVPYTQPQAPAQQPSNYREPRYVPYVQPQAPAQQPSNYQEPRYVPNTQSPQRNKQSETASQPTYPRYSTGGQIINPKTLPQQQQQASDALGRVAITGAKLASGLPDTSPKVGFWRGLGTTLGFIKKEKNFSDAVQAAAENVPYSERFGVYPPEMVKPAPMPKYK